MEVFVVSLMALVLGLFVGAVLGVTLRDDIEDEFLAKLRKIVRR